MHDPQTVAHEIKSPFKHKSELFKDGYRNSLFTIWHVDPETDGTDDSCGWFMRPRHGNQEVLNKIVKAFEFDWDRTFTSDGTGKIYYMGFFYPDNNGAGMPIMSVHGIALNLFLIAASHHFGCDGRTNWVKSRKFCQEHLFDILMFAENPTDSLKDSICRTFGESDKREERIRQMAGCIYSWILRAERPWYKHPKWHVHHWKIQCHFLQTFKRWAFSRCCKCHKGFSWGYSPVTNSWNGEGPRWFRGEPDVFHSDCDRPTNNCCASSEN